MFERQPCAFYYRFNVDKAPRHLVLNIDFLGRQTMAAPSIDETLSYISCESSTVVGATYNKEFLHVSCVIWIVLQRCWKFWKRFRAQLGPFVSLKCASFFFGECESFATFIFQRHLLTELISLWWGKYSFIFKRIICCQLNVVESIEWSSIKRSGW